MAVDAEGAVKAWVNSRTQDLVGPGHPVQLGAFLTHNVRGPGRGAYAFLQVVSGARTLTAERPVHTARISAQMHAPTREVCARAAVAYATVLEALDGVPTVMGEAVCHTVADITGPLAVDNHESNREQWIYVVDADFYLTLAPVTV